jgi:DNA-binding NarL/FixJ family response regulator
VNPMHARILVVDDHELTRMGIKAALADNPEWEICGEALDGTEAVEMALQLKPDLIVMDIIMPTMSGIEAARQIRRISPQTKILMLSVHDSPSIGTFVKLAGADAFLSKLRSSDYLHETVAQLLS